MVDAMNVEKGLLKKDCPRMKKGSQAEAPEIHISLFLDFLFRETCAKLAQADQS